MKLNFISVTVQNFRSYGNQPETFKFENGLTLVNGANGNGKTSIFLHAVVYGLFGEGLNKEKVDTLINDINKKNMLVTLEVENNGVNYKIVRGRNKNILEIYKDGVKVDQVSAKDDQDYIQDNVLKGVSINTFYKLFVIQANSQSISIFRMNTKERRELLESLFDLTAYSIMQKEIQDKLNEDAFTLTNYKNDTKHLSSVIDGTKININLQRENLESIKKNLVEVELSLKEAEKVSKDGISNVEKEIEDVRKTLPFTKENLAIEIKEKEEIKEVIKKSNLVYTSLINSKKDYDKMEAVEKTLFESIKKEKENLENNNKEIEKIKQSILTFKTNNKILSEAELKEYNSKIKKLQEDSLTINKKIMETDVKFQSVKEIKMSFENCKDVDCINEGLKKLSGSTISEKEWGIAKLEMQKEITKKSDEIVQLEKIKNEQLELNKQLNKLEQELKLKDNNSNNLINKIKDIKKTIDDNLIAINKIFTSLTSLIKKDDINKSNYDENYLFAVSKVEEKIKKTEESLKLKEERINSFNNKYTLIENKEKVLLSLKANDNVKQKFEKEEKIKNLKVTIETKKKELEETIEKNKKNGVDLLLLENKTKELEKQIKVKTEVHKFLKNEELKYFIIQKSFDVLKKDFNTILDDFFSGDVRVNITDQFDISIRHNGISKDFEQFSEGEKKRLDLGFVFTLHSFLEQKNQIKTNIMIMDELLDSALDSDGMDAIMEYIYKMKSEKNIIIVSHKADNLVVDRKFMVEKQNKFSKLIEIQI